MADGMKISRFRQYNVDFDRQIANWLAEQFCGVCFFSGGYYILCIMNFFFIKKKIAIKFYIIFHKFSVFIFSVISWFLIGWMGNCFISQSNKTY